MSSTTPPEHSGWDRRERPPPGERWSSPGEASQGPDGRNDTSPPPPIQPGNGYGGPGTAPSAQAAQIADVARRVGADLVDFLVLALLGAVVGLVLGQLGLAPAVAPGMRGEPADGLSLSLLSTVVTLVIHLGYWTLMEGSRGQSVGKLALGIRAVRKDGSPLDYVTAFKRHVLFYLPQLVGWIPILAVLILAGAAQVALVLAGLVTYVVDQPLHQGFHDKYAGTIVVRA